jgi:hypothetical protein
MRRVGHIAHMGDRRGANGFWWKNLGDRYHLENLGLYGSITLKWLFRLIYHFHDSKTTKWKTLTTEEPSGLYTV